MPALTDRERAVLRFARLRWTSQDAAADVVDALFGWSYTRYCQVLNALVKRAEALEAEPQVVRRLQRLQEQGRGLAPAVVDPRQSRRAMARRPLGR